jgi:lipoprotein-releasing system ATP-binding protein
MEKSLISLKNISKRLEGEVPYTLLSDVSLDIGKGEFVVVTGPSGSGKSSLLYLLGLLDSPTSGSYFFKGVDTSKYSDQEKADIRLRDIGFVFQFHFLLPEFSALENVMIPMKKLGKLNEKEIEERAEYLLTSLGLKEQLKKVPRQLSGGQSQRVAIARALANSPSMILADEPTGNLDTKSTANVKTILRELTKEFNTTVITVTHDTSFSEEGDRLITVVDGRVV